MLTVSKPATEAEKQLSAFEASTGRLALGPFATVSRRSLMLAALLAHSAAAEGERPHRFGGPYPVATKSQGVASPTTARTLSVNSTADPGSGGCDESECTLREAIELALSGDTIVFAPQLFSSPQFIGLRAPLPDLNHAITIQGPGARLLTVQRAAVQEFPIFIAFAAGDITISGMTITGGGAFSSPDVGGGVSAYSYVILRDLHIVRNRALAAGGGVSLQGGGEVHGCAVIENTSDYAAGVLLLDGGDMTIANSTLSGNISQSYGGGIGVTSYVRTRIEIINSTIAHNHADIRGSGVDIYASPFISVPAVVSLRNTIVAENGSSNLFREGWVEMESLGFNLSEDYNGALRLLNSDLVASPLLDVLRDNGGNTPTHALLPGSPALDRGHQSGARVDQRGFQRPVDLPSAANGNGDGADIGAFELQDAAAAPLFAHGFEQEG